MQSNIAALDQALERTGAKIVVIDPVTQRFPDSTPIDNL
jgi:hypothetical protein